MLPSIGIQSMPESIPSGMPRMSSMTVLPKSMPCGCARHVNLAEHGKRANNGCSPRVLNYVMTVSPRVKITLYRTGILCLQLVGFPKTEVQKPVGFLTFCPPLHCWHFNTTSVLNTLHYECSQHFNNTSVFNTLTLWVFSMIMQVGTLLYWSMLAACSVGPGTVVVCARYLSPTLVQISQQGICHLLEPSSPTWTHKTY